MSQGQIRIIGGKWRGRKLTVPSTPHLRPTPDRVRETVFNWLLPVIVDAYCLDAFAGSGALGFEALSRGAKAVVLVDAAQEAVKLLQQTATHFAADNAEIYCANVPKQLRHPQKPFDIVFLDPPFQQNILLPTCFFLENEKFLAEQAYIYLEAPAFLQQNDLPENWTLLKIKKAGQVAYHLAKRNA